jgi:hypothetical protein
MPALPAANLRERVGGPRLRPGSRLPAHGTEVDGTGSRALDGKAVGWLEQVIDEEYLSG